MRERTHRRHHHGQVVHQIPHHLERRRAGAMMMPGTQLYRGHPCAAKQLATVAPGVEVATVAGLGLDGPR